jgi:hypothetical protein
MTNVRYLLGLLVLIAVAGRLKAQVDDAYQLVVDDPRPVASAAEKLETLYGWVITYEDPEWVVPTETADLTDQVRRDVVPGNQVPRVLVPRGGLLKFPLPEVKVIHVADRASLLKQLLAASESAGYPGKFQIFESDGVLHIVPMQDPDVNDGSVPLLDVKVSIPNRDWTGLDLLHEICQQLGKRAGRRVILGAIPVHTLGQYHAPYSALGIPARQVLSSLLSRLGSGYSWQLFFDPGMRMYALNIHWVSSN